MLILDVTVCNDPGLANILSIIKQILDLIQLLGPIIAIIGLMVILIKIIMNPDDKKLTKAFQNWLIALIMLFFIPIIVNGAMKLLDDSFELSTCWNYATTAKPNGDSQYIDPYQEDNRKPIIPNYSDMEPSKQTSSPSSSQQTTISKLIFIGDSRTVQMQAAVKTNDVWSCKGSIGLSWMQSTGVPQIENSITTNSAIIILMGVNDLYHPNSYIDYINSKITSWTGKGAKIYFVSVMPTSGSYNSLNTEIDSFNTTLKNGLSNKVKYIDANSYLKSNGFTATDGLHYDSTTYNKIYNFIKENL